ncbi:IS3 family transposase [Phascolarctobacterium succinatutens]
MHLNFQKVCNFLLQFRIEKYITYYNKYRIKSKLNWMSPVEYRLSFVA